MTEIEYETTEIVAVCPACRTPLLLTLSIQQAELQCPRCRRAFVERHGLWKAVKDFVERVEQLDLFESMD